MKQSPNAGKKFSVFGSGAELSDRLLGRVRQHDWRVLPPGALTVRSGPFKNTVFVKLIINYIYCIFVFWPRTSWGWSNEIARYIANSCLYFLFALSLNSAKRALKSDPIKSIDISIIRSRLGCPCASLVIVRMVEGSKASSLQDALGVGGAPLWFKPEDFLSPAFSGEAYVSDLRRYVSLHFPFRFSCLYSIILAVM
jgi:hypothetical protein